MQVDETVYDTIQKCTQHSNGTKHSSLIINEKCSTSFEKNCSITYQPMKALKKICNDKIVGEEVCKTKYETSCKTAEFKEFARRFKYGWLHLKLY